MFVKKIGIVSLSSGVLGEDFVSHEVEIGLKRLKEYGVEVVFLPNSLKGIKTLKENPQLRATDLIEAFKDSSIDMIFCAIGGDDTYKLLPYLFENDELKKIVNQKIFLGFSDTTINHFMLNKLGIKTFYGQAFLPDVCELSGDMLSYSKKYFEELISTGKIKEVRASDIWYEERKDFSKKGIGIKMKTFPNKGFELINGKPLFEGKILGGCIETIYDMFDNTRYDDSSLVCKKYEIFPSLDKWKDNILLLETSEEKSSPQKYKKMIKKLNETGIFNVISGLLVGKPREEVYYNEYKEVLLEEISNKDLSILYNVNIGHATPRCIIPFGVKAKVNFNEGVISFDYNDF